MTTAIKYRSGSSWTNLILPIAYGGTGSSSASGARSGLGVTTVTTPITLSNGGTGSTSASGARTNLGLGPFATAAYYEDSSTTTPELLITHGGLGNWGINPVDVFPDEVLEFRLYMWTSRVNYYMKGTDAGLAFFLVDDTGYNGNAARPYCVLKTWLGGNGTGVNLDTNHTGSWTITVSGATGNKYVTLRKNSGNFNAMVFHTDATSHMEFP